MRSGGQPLDSTAVSAENRLVLDPSQLRSIEVRLRAVERHTGAQVVVATVDRADVYHGLRWRAFAFGAATAGAVVVLAALRPAAAPNPGAFFAVAAVLGAGLILALAATLSASIARLFLEPLRAEAEVGQRAASIFLEREIFATRARTGVLLLASRFERRAVARGDVGYRGRVTDEEWRSVADAATAHLRAGREAEGLIAGLEALERLIAAKGFAPSAGSGNELPDRPVAEAGV